MKAHDRRSARKTLATLLTGMPVTERRLELAGVSTAVLEGGDGPPVVLLHGAGEFAACWMRVIPDLVRTHRVVAARPARPRRLGGGRWPAGRRAGGRLARRADRADLPVAAGAGRAWARRASRPASPSTRVTGSPGWCSWTATGWAASGRRRGSRSPCSASSCDRPSSTQEALFRQCVVDLDRLREQLGERWELLEAYALDRARTPGPEGRAPQPHAAVRAAGDPAGGAGPDHRAHDPDLGTARPAGARSRSPRPRAPATAGRCT